MEASGSQENLLRTSWLLDRNSGDVGKTSSLFKGDITELLFMTENALPGDFHSTNYA